MVFTTTFSLFKKYIYRATGGLRTLFNLFQSPYKNERAERAGYNMVPSVRARATYVRGVGLLGSIPSEK